MTFSKDNKNTKVRKVILKALSALFWIALWALAAMTIGKELIVPSPFVVVKRLCVLVTEPEFWIKTGVSLLRILSGFVLGTLFGVVLAVLSSLSDIPEAVITPFIRVIRATPVASFIILVMLWIPYTYVPVFTSGLMVAPIVYMNVYEGIREANKELLEVARVFGFGKVKTVFKVYVPLVKPYFISAAVTALGLAWKAGIAAEVLCLPKKSIGSEIYYSKIYLETPDLFAWTIVVVLFSFILEKLFSRFVKKKKKEKSEGDKQD